MVTNLEGKRLKDMIIGAASMLEQNKNALDALNVFPVPDGDTGTNMSLTMLSAAKEASVVSEDADFRDVIDAMSTGALKGARGNSGVILSQIFAGIAYAVKHSEGDFDVDLFARALNKGVEFAYKAVMKPKEGTILTVAKSIARAADKKALQTKDISEFLDYVLYKGEKTLKETPEMLPVLKEAGVVDAGGAGLIVILMGFKSVLDGHEISSEGLLDQEVIVDFANIGATEEITFGYCTEFFIKNVFPDTQERDIDVYRNNLAKIGDCVLVVGDLNLIKTHVHTNEPGLALQYAQILGELSRIKIDNMREQHNELQEAEEKNKKHVAVVAISCGEGISNILRDWQIDELVEGGQSMNPSTHDILVAIDKTSSDNVIVLPNNKNIILAAEQAADLSKKNVVVIKTKSIPQGVGAAISYDPDADIAENERRMKKAAESVRTGLVTNAVRDTTLNGRAITEGDIIGIAESEIVANGDDIFGVIEGLLKNISDDDCELLTIYYGCDTEESQAQEVMDRAEKLLPHLDVELTYGGQPVYRYMISVE